MMFSFKPWHRTNNHPTKKTRKANKYPKSRRATSRRLGSIEQLEDRRLLTVSEDLVAQLKPYQNALNNALDVATNLPLVGKQLADLQRWNTVFQDSVTSLASRVDSLTNGRFQLEVPLPSLETTFTFDLGLDAFLQVHTSGGVSAAINPVLNVGFNLSNGVPALDPARTGLDINFVIGLPNFELTASLNGLLYAKAIDAGTTFSGKLGFAFDTGFRLQPRFSGDARVRLGFSLSLTDPALNASFNPKFSTDFELDWGFDTQSNDLKVPQIAFRNFSLDVDSFMQGFMADTVKAVQKFTKPMQPFIDMFEQPVPILSSFDSSETMGDLFLKGARLSSEQIERFEMMVQIVSAVNSFDFAGSTGGSVVNFGDILLSGDARLPGQFLFNTGALSNVIDDIVNSPQLQALEDKLKTLARYAGFNANAGFKYPLLENPGPVVGSLLTGIPETMFSYSTGRQHFELSAAVGVGIPDVLGVFLEAGLIFDASLSVGYDTNGLLEFVKDPQKRPEKLLYGFYIDNGIDTSGPPIPGVPNPRNTALYLQGFAALKASAGVTVSGGLYADVQMELASNNVSTRVYLADIITGLASNTKVFNPSGKLYAAANIELTLPNPVGPDITLFEHQLSYFELLNFNAPRPIASSVPVTIIDVNDQHSVMLDATKMTANGQVKVQPFHDVPIASGIGYLGDGIRVDYPNEIVLYVQRKNDITTNYYNFIGLSGNVPEGVSIDIVDPFSVFVTEGAPDPRPAQTGSGILLVGGKNVVYRYRESSGGAPAKVLMVGGYGSNTLAGGTMLFGNFIPANRLAQAKSHFGDVSGYDAATQAFIQTQLDSMQAPASPAGIIGSTLTARRGGLMVGGPGNNSFFAEGPGHYDMIGGTWTNNFTISPSFNAARATYQIDGGPYGKSTLVVRVPKGENVVFENSTLDDKYNPSFKALAITANAGLSATAHGIKKVQINATSGSEVTIGDTSLLNTEFAITGGARLTFGGSSAPDIFSVTTTGHYHSRADRTYPWRVINTAFTEPGKPTSMGVFAWGPMPALPFPTYSVTRTFGTNGRTQVIPFAISDAASSSIALNAGGANDAYSITMGLGAFIDIAVTDSDVNTSNTLTVSTGDTNLVYNTVNFTDTAIELDYYTASYVWSIATQHNTIYPFTTTYYMTSVHYTPVVSFSANVAPKLQAALPFSRVTINRPLGLQPAEFLLGGPRITTPIPYLGLGSMIGVWDVYTNPWTRIPAGNGGQPYVTQILANGGSLLIARTLTTANPTTVFNVLGNTGTLEFVNSSNVVWSGPLLLNIFGSSGAINVNEASLGLALQPSAASAQINVGAGGTLANISGTISLTSTRGLVNLMIDDRANTSSKGSWQAFADKTTIGNLTINHGVNLHGLVSDRVSQYEAFPKAGALFAYEQTPSFFIQQVNGGAFPSDLSLTSSLISVRRGQTISEQIWAYSSTPGTITFSATGLPPGLSISSSGLITGTVSAAATEENYTAKVTVIRNGTLGRISSMSWSIGSSIEIQVPASLQRDPQIEGTAPPAQRLTAISLFNRPVTFTVTNLPPGITFNSSTARFGGRYAIGSAQNGSYQTTIHATDGVDSTSITFSWLVTGISLANPGKQFNRVGDTINLPITYSIASGATGTITVGNLPEGLSYNETTRRITGSISSSAQIVTRVFIQIDNGNDSRFQEFDWITLPVGVSNLLDFYPMSDRHLHEGQSAFIVPSIYNSLRLPITLTATGLPPGLSVTQREGDWWIEGTIQPGAATNSPYRVQLLASDDHWSTTTEFEISVGISSSVSFNFSDYSQTNSPWDIVSAFITASSALGETITYSATGLPPGLTIDPSTGYVDGYLTENSSSPQSYKVTVTATTASGSDQTKFNWNFIASYEGPHVAVIAHPQGPVTITSPLGSELLVSYRSSAGVPTPTGSAFRMGYFSFTVRNLAPGQSADLTIWGLDLASVDDYLNYGATPANTAAHWYRFLFGQATDADNALGTGMEIVDGRIVLHLVDGGRGDHDLTMNGSISSLGGPARRVSQPPVISNFGGSVTHTENSAPVILDADVTVTDVDSNDFADGRLTVVTAVNAQATDRVRVKHTGNGPGQIGVDGYNILYGGQIIGTFTGASALVVRLNASATAAAVQALLRSVTFAVVTDAPSTLPRRIDVKLTDGDGGASLTSTSTVNVIAVNDRPVIREFAGQVTYTENGPAVVLDSDATVSDVDSRNFDSGKLTVAIIANAESSDRIRVRHTGNAAGQIGVSGTTISYGGVVIGSFTGATALVISLNAQATPAAVQALLRSVTYFTASDTPSTLNRTVRVFLTDGDGGTSTLSYKTIQVIAANDAPTIGSFGPNASYTVAGPAVFLAPTATINDADSSDFNTGVLTISTTTNAQATDLLAIANQGTGVGQVGVNGSNITFQGVLIGVRSGGNGATPLTVTFNANATANAVAAVLRRATWSSTSSTPSTLARTIRVTLSDGDSGLSQPLSKRIDLI